MEELNNKEIVKLILDSLRYMPYVYREVQNLTDGNRNETTEVYYIKHKADKLDPNMIMFFLPRTPGKNVNLIKILSALDGYDQTKAKTYKVYVEKSDGQLTTTLDGGITAIQPDRLIMFRLGAEPTTTTHGKIIVINDPHKGSVTATDLTVNGTTHFSVHPTVGSNDYTLVDLNEFNKLAARVRKLEEKIIVGTEDPARALQDQPEGTIYLQVDSYGNENK
jgi:hypothetical protein